MPECGTGFLQWADLWLEQAENLAGCDLDEPISRTALANALMRELIFDCLAAMAGEYSRCSTRCLLFLCQLTIA